MTEKDLKSTFGRYRYDLDDESTDEAMRAIRSANSLSISPELFEKIYLSPKTRLRKDQRRSFANPTPL
jgi:uncharacterized protein